jgi:hypothetical protein
MPRRTAPKPASETDYADHLKHKAGPSRAYFEDSHVLHIPVRRPVLSLPEPVDVSRALCRPRVEEWEMELIIEARQRERRAELVLFRGLTG